LLAWVGWAALRSALASAGIDPEARSFGAVAFTMLAWQGLHVVLLTIMVAFTLVRAWAGRSGPSRRAALDSTLLVLYFSLAQGVAIVAALNAPRLT
jgi:cytochrome c oxidase subunit I+III